MKINEKILFKMLYTMAPFYQREEKYLQFRSVLRKKRIPEDEIETFFLQFFNLFVDIVKANTLTPELFNMHQIACSPQLEIDLKINRTPIQNFCYIIKNRLFGEYSKEIASIVYNAYRYKDNQLPLIIGNRLLERLEHEISDGLVESSVEKILLRCETKSLFFNQTYPSLSTEELVRLLRKEQKFIQSNYPIQNMWLYGSFARQEQTEYSDIDLMIETISFFDLHPLKEYLTIVCQRPVDIKLYYPDVPFFSRDAVKEKICIFNDI